MTKLMTQKQTKKYAEIARQTYQKEMIKIKVEWFAERMKDELNKHLDRPGWKKESFEFLWNRLLEELGEVFDAIQNEEDKDSVVRECADIANFAMMIADVYEASDD